MARPRPIPKAIIAAAALAVFGACAPAPPPRPAAKAMEPSKIESLVSFSEGGWKKVVSRRFFVAFPLPDGPDWRIDDTTGRWLAAVHLPSKSMIWVRAWHEGAVVSHRDCEATARSYRPDLLGHDESALHDRRPLGAPPGFDTEVGFSVSRNQAALGAVAAAFGAHVRQCLVVIYATRADGPDAEEIVADRVGFIVDRVFGRLRTLTIDDRVEPLEHGSSYRGAE